jgi:hypothetical protein
VKQVDVAEPQPLQNAPRHVRLLAAARLEPLVERLAEIATEYAGNVERAKAVLDGDTRK